MWYLVNAVATFSSAPPEIIEIVARSKLAKVVETLRDNRMQILVNEKK